jgi:hypothetical protein
MSRPEDRDSLRELVSALCDGSLDEKEIERLNELLEGDPEACEYYLNFFTLEALLDRETQACELDLATLPNKDGLQGKPKESSRRVASPTIWISSLAALLMVGLGVGWWLMSMAAARSVAFATLLVAENCRWSTDQEFDEGSRLGGETLSLQSGTAVIRFDGGVEAAMRGTTELELHSAAQAKLNLGDIVFRGSDQESNFRLITPHNEFVGLIEESAVQVDTDGATEVEVREGELSYVSLTYHDTKSWVSSGQALRFETDQAVPREVPLRSPSFEEVLRQSGMGPQLERSTAYEGFEYPDGLYDAEELDGGTGWRGPWRIRREDEAADAIGFDIDRSTRVLHRLLEAPSWFQAGGQGMLETKPGEYYRVRRLAQPVEFNTDGITYFSLISHEPAHASPRSQRVDEKVRIVFRSSRNLRNDRTDLLSFGWGVGLTPRISVSNSQIFNSPIRLRPEQTLLWIGKMIRRSTGEDELSFIVYSQDDQVDFAEPSTWHVVSRGVDLDNSFDLILLCSDGASARLLDELRIGPTWRSVVPFEAKR